MNWEKWCFRFGVGLLAVAVAVRLAAAGVFSSALRVMAAPETLSLIFFLETGKVIRPGVPGEEMELPRWVLGQKPPEEKTEEKQPVVLSQEDAALVQVSNLCGIDTDVEAWISQPLTIKLQEQAPTVLILQSHGTESYVNQEGYGESGDSRTKDTDYNVVSVGAALKETLEAGGVSVIHDRTMHDDPSYNASYGNSRKSVQQYLQDYPSISLVLDIHRDAVTDDKGNQRAMRVEKDGQSVAQLMLVVGTDVRLSHPGWPENMSLAVKLHALLEKNVPGICRPISFRSQRFNQDLSPGALLIEVGAAGNTRQEALAAAKILGETILQLTMDN